MASLAPRSSPHPGWRLRRPSRRGTPSISGIVAMAAALRSSAGQHARPRLRLRSRTTASPTPTTPCSPCGDCTWEEAIGKNCLELGYEPWHAAMHDREIDQVIATGKPVRGDVPFTGTNGRRVYDYIFFPVFGANWRSSRRRRQYARCHRSQQHGGSAARE